MKKIAALLLLVAANAFAEPPSIESLFKLPQFAAMRISPDGSSIAALAPVAGRQNLVVLDTRTRKPFPVTGFTDRDIVDVRWVNSKRLLVRTGTLNTRESDNRGGGLYAIDKDGARPCSPARRCRLPRSSGRPRRPCRWRRGRRRGNPIRAC